MCGYFDSLFVIVLKPIKYFWGRHGEVSVEELGGAVSVLNNRGSFNNLVDISLMRLSLHVIVAEGGTEGFSPHIPAFSGDSRLLSPIFFLFSFFIFMRSC